MINKKLKTLMAFALICPLATCVSAKGKTDKDEPELSIRLGNGITITSINHPIEDFDPLSPLEPQTLTRSIQYEYPTLPLAGFTPYVAIAMSDKSEDNDLEFAHTLESQYNGNSLTSQPGYPEMPYIIGILDSGSETDIIAGSSAEFLGLSGEYLSGLTMPIGGVGEETIETDITNPLGLYVAGINDIESGNYINPGNFVGHSNNVLLAAPAITCYNQETVSGLVGRGLIGFYTSVIRNDQKKTVNVNGQEFTGPSIDFLSSGSTDIPDYTRIIPITIADSSTAASTVVTTAAYYSLNFPEFGIELTTPTALTSGVGSISLGASFAVEVEITQDGRTKTFNFLLDTGAQSSILSENAAYSLGLPLTGDFTVDICGVSGVLEDVPGYYVDTMEIYGGGGPLSFSHVPMIVTDFGTAFDGILGMNTFYDRNITLEPDISQFGSSCLLYVSDPVNFADADFNDDNKVNMIDFSLFANSWMTSFGDLEYDIQYDLFLTDTIDDYDLEVFLNNWLE